MPTYDYVCTSCGHQFDDHLKTCPKCQKDALKRKIGRGAAVIFKGAGFYCNDYHSSTHDAPKAKSEAK